MTYKVWNIYYVAFCRKKFADTWIKVIPIMNWMVVSLQNSCLSPNSNVIVFGGRTFGRQLGLDEVIRGISHNEISILKKRGREIRAPSLSATWRHSVQWWQPWYYTILLFLKLLFLFSKFYLSYCRLVHLFNIISLKSFKNYIVLIIMWLAK